jgi:hypothetical protein
MLPKMKKIIISKYCNIKCIIGLFLLIFSVQVEGQELFLMTDPASNMPTNTLRIRDMNAFMDKTIGGLNYHNMPELMWGINKNWMISVAAFISNRSNSLVSEGGSVYAKYRFYSVDDLHSHFRLAAFGRYSLNNADIHQEELEIMGHNSGYELGIVGTKLIKKVAVSATFSYERALKNMPNYEFPSTQSNNALNYTLSIGKLMYPKVYTSLKQTNINLMVEILGQRLIGNAKSSLDIVPSIQFILFSTARIDIGYRQQLYSNLTRTAPNGFVLKLEYTINYEKKKLQ